MNCDVLFLYPPVSKPAEPPAGVAQLKSALQAHHITCAVIDANLDGLTYLIDSSTPGDTRKQQTAFRNSQKNMRIVRSLASLKKFDHYKRSILELNQVLGFAGQPFNAGINFTDFKHKEFIPVRSDDLLRAAARPQDNPFYDYFINRLLPDIDRHSPNVIGISLIYLSQAVTTFALIGLLRQRWPEVKIVLGGGLVTSWMSQPGWRNPFGGLVEKLVAGRGEEPLLRYVGVTSPVTEHFTPDYANTAWDDYFSPARILPYSASTGCYWRNCTFCPECAEGTKFSPLPHSHVLEDLVRLQVHKPALIHFLDNALTPALLKSLISTPLPAPWYGYVRFIQELEDADFCVALRRSGCLLIKLGLESGNQDVLDAMRKGIDISRVSLILHNLKNAGISTYIYLLFGTPYEDENQARDTLNFVLDHGDCINYINPAIFNMPVFSDEAAFHSTHTFYEGDLTLYHDFDHPKGWSRARVRQFLQKEFRSHPVIKKILLANPPFFTSNHAPFFTDYFLKR